MEDQGLLRTRREATPDHGPVDVSYPLRGVILCCTSIPPEKRSELASQAEQMGASHKYDLTSEITHLIVGNYDTPKYRYVAKERPDVKVLTPKWIEAVCKLWIEDQPINVAATEREHALPTFATMKICLTGFDDPQRQHLIEQVRDHGGEYHGDLTKKVTHLVANKPEGAKYKHAKAWGLQVVSVEWLQASVERGMILDEKLFNPEWPVDDRGADAWNRSKASLLGKRPRGDDKSTLDEGKRKLRRTASMKLSSQNEKIWGDIFGGSNAIQAANSGEWEVSAEKAPQQQSTVAATKVQSASESNSLSRKTATNLLGGTFNSCHFYIHGFTLRTAQILQGHLLSHDAEISATLDDLVTIQCEKKYLVVPHSMSASNLPDIPDSAKNIQAVTEWWVECCIVAKSLTDPAEDVLARPFLKFPLDGFPELTISSTGFEGVQLLHIAKAVKLMGANYEETFSKDVSVLVCNSSRNLRREKLDLAHECKIPTVSLDWLLDSIQKAERQLFSPYIQRIKEKNPNSTATSSTDKEAARCKRDDAGEFKAETTRPSSKEDPQPAKATKFDPTAFQDNRSVKIKVEDVVPPVVSLSPVQALTELSPNSPLKQESPPKKPISVELAVAPRAIPQQALSTAMTSLLAKSKTAATHARDYMEQADIPGARKKRAPTRILGRAPSNLSSASAGSSVDSTASTGQAIVWPPNKSSSGDWRSSSSLRGNLQQDTTLMALATDLQGTGADKDSHPPQTQVQYDDPESKEYEARILARIKGEKFVVKEIEKVVTIGSLNAGEAPRIRKGRALRERQGGGLR